MRTCKRHANESVTYCWQCLEEARYQAQSEAMRASRRELKAVLMALRARGIYFVTVSQDEGHRALRGELVTHMDRAGVTHYRFVPAEEAGA